MLVKSSVGKKILMAITGQMMLFFIIIHVIGNSTVFFGGLNAYAEKLHSLQALVWITRIMMLTMVVLHIFFGIILTLENRDAKPEKYAVQKNLCSSFASRNMIWTGAVIGIFLIYHLFHFTFQVTNPASSAAVNLDAVGRPDVSGMVIAGFQNFAISIVYLISMISLLLHLTHGIQSSFQTMGLNNDSAMPLIIKTGTVVAIVLFIGYVSIPAAIFFGIVKG